MRRLVVILAGLLVLTAPLVADAASVHPAGDAIAQLEDRVTALEGRVAALEATPTPAPTPTPTPVPTPTPTPVPTPTPTPVPTPTPTPTATPVACDATFGAPTGSDQSAAIASFLGAHSGQTVCFQPNATYISQARIALDSWSGTIKGQGATIKRTLASATGEQFKFSWGSIVIDGLNVTGPATLSNIQSRTFGSGDQEDEHAFTLQSVASFTYRNATVTGTWGDAVYARSVNYNGDNSPSTNVTISNVTMNIIGRNCVSVISANGLTVTGSHCSNVSLHGFDAEPNRSTDVVTNITVTLSDWRAFDAGHTPSGPGYAVVLTPGYANVNPSDIAITSNTMDKPMVRVDGYSTTSHATTVLVTGNRPDVAGAATFTHVTGLTFSDNGLMTASRSDVS